MLKFSDFFHLPQLDALMGQLIQDTSPGMVVVTGPEPRVLPGGGAAILGSGRSTVFDILLQEMLAAHPDWRAVFVTRAKGPARPARQLKPRLSLAVVQPPLVCSEVIIEAARRRPGLLVIDRLDEHTQQAAFEVAGMGLRVLTQFDTLVWGQAVPRQLQELGVPAGQAAALRWVLSVQRFPALCPQCRREAALTPHQVEQLRARFPCLDTREPFYAAAGCSHCHFSGRAGEVAAFDLYHEPAGPAQDPPASLLPLEGYMLSLAGGGYLAVDDLLHLESDSLRRAASLLAAAERSQAEARATLARKQAELDAANLVLLRRTEALVSLEGTVHTLITDARLEELARRVCERAAGLCGADRVILYYLPAAAAEAVAEVLALVGWDENLLHQAVDVHQVMAPTLNRAPAAYPGLPPGVSGLQGQPAALQAGLGVPLYAQERQVGLMIIHTTQKKVFTPGEAALLQAFANQAALAIQRAGLVEELSAKIAALEEAQEGLMKKERLERELELAHQVQQSILPKVFPRLPGLAFAARSEPARHVGGDFYDVIALEDGRAGLVIADVSDKGLAAALYMALTRSLILAEARRAVSPRQVLGTVNRLLLELGEAGRFVSVFYGVLDCFTHRLTYSRAGHDRPLLLRDGTVLSLAGSGAVLGVLENSDLHLSEESLDLQPGDRLVLYTDGLPDTAAPGGGFFGSDRLEALLSSLAHLQPAELCAAVYDHLGGFQKHEEQYDDMTLLVVGLSGLD